MINLKTLYLLLIEMPTWRLSGSFKTPYLVKTLTKKQDTKIFTCLNSFS